jgi:hypothetical protein
MESEAHLFAARETPKNPQRFLLLSRERVEICTSGNIGEDDVSGIASVNAGENHAREGVSDRCGPENELIARVIVDDGHAAWRGCDN